MAVLHFPLVNTSDYDKLYQSSKDLPIHCFVRHGVVYAAQLRDRIKIGVTTHPRKRLMQMEGTIGERYSRIYLSKPSKTYKKTEVICHRAFLWDKGVGEWFSVLFEDAVDMIKSNLVEDQEIVKFKDYDSEKYYEYKEKKKPWIKVKGLHD